MAPIYGAILVKHSSYAKPQNDRQAARVLDTEKLLLLRAFFETLYDALSGILCSMFERLHKDAEIETEIGRLFRGQHFNLNQQKHQLPRSVNTLSLRQLYEIKYKSENTSLNARILTELYKKRPGLDTKASAQI